MSYDKPKVTIDLDEYNNLKDASTGVQFTLKDMENMFIIMKTLTFNSYLTNSQFNRDDEWEKWADVIIEHLNKYREQENRPLFDFK